MATRVQTLVTLMLLACPLPALAADLRIACEIVAHGEDLAGRLEATIEEMKAQLADSGCERMAVSSWSDAVPLERLRVEVTCYRPERPETLTAVRRVDR